MRNPAASCVPDLFRVLLPRAGALSVAALLGVSWLLPACRGSRLPTSNGLRERASASPTPPTHPAASSPGDAPLARPLPGNSTRGLPRTFDKVVRADVRLSARDLRPVDAWLGKRNTQWILGDVVDVYASREYFASVLTLNAKTGLVHTRETTVGGDPVTILTYVGAKFATNAMRAPRVQIGTGAHGLSVSARKVLRVRMAKTRDPARPVQLRVVARGQAVHGTHEQVLRRGEGLEVGGVLRRSGGRWYWVPIVR